MDSIRHIPCIAVQGRLDFVTPVRTAYDLHCAWPEMELRVVPVRSNCVRATTMRLLYLVKRLPLRFKICWLCWGGHV